MNVSSSDRVECGSFEISLGISIFVSYWNMSFTGVELVDGTVALLEVKLDLAADFFGVKVLVCRGRR